MDWLTGDKKDISVYSRDMLAGTWRKVFKMPGGEISWPSGDIGLLIEGLWLLTGRQYGILPSGSGHPTVILDPGSFFLLLFLPDSHVCKVVRDRSPAQSLLFFYTKWHPAEISQPAFLNENNKMGMPADPKCPDTLSPSALSPSIPSEGTVTESPFERAIQQRAGPRPAVSSLSEPPAAWSAQWQSLLSPPMQHAVAAYLLSNFSLMVNRRHQISFHPLSSSPARCFPLVCPPCRQGKVLN